MIFFRVSEKKWYAIRKGEGNPCFLWIHGAGSDHTIWGRFIRPPFKGTHYFLDLPAHGRSQGPPKVSISGMARVLKEFMQTIQCKKVVLVGHSMGGALSLEMALEYPDIVIGLVLFSTGARLRVHPHLLNLLKMGQKREALEWILQYMVPKTCPKDIRQLIEKKWMACSTNTILADFLACHMFDRLEDVSNIRVPTLIFVSDDDKLTPVKYSHYLHENIDGSELYVLQESGHVPMLLKAQECKTTFKKWIDKTLHRWWK